MTSPIPKLPNPLLEYRRVQLRVDADMKRVLEATAKRIRRRIEGLGTGIGAQVRAAQLRLVLNEINRLLGTMWSSEVLDVTQAGRKASAEVAETVAETLTAVAYTALPDDVAEALTRGLRLSAASAIANAFARVPRELSSRVYRHISLDRGWVSKTISEGLASGLSAKELARDVYRYVSPTTPGGASYAAMRLARTEINNAFHERQRAGGNRPGVKAIRWNLSGSHRVPDECNLYAQRDSHNQGAGVFPIGKVPDKPHPQCFCYLTYVTMTPGEFRDALSNGDFDDELDRRTKENLRRLGFGT